MKSEHLQVLLDRKLISQRVNELGDAISRDYHKQRLVLMCVLKGAVIFLADLLRNIDIPVEIDFVAASSYHRATSEGRVNLSPFFSAAVRNKHVLIVEDIIDTGLTYRALMNYLSVREPLSIKLCALLDKPSPRRTEVIRPDYLGFTVPDKFVVGYGLDFDEKYRHLQDICILET